MEIMVNVTKSKISGSANRKEWERIQELGIRIGDILISTATRKLPEVWNPDFTQLDEPGKREGSDRPK